MIPNFEWTLDILWGKIILGTIVASGSDFVFYRNVL